MTPNQLVSADYGPRDEVFEYDAVDNRVRVVNSASGTTEYGRNNLNQYTSIGATTPTYDSNGNLTSSASGEYTYDGGNRLILPPPDRPPLDLHTTLSTDRSPERSTV